MVWWQVWWVWMVIAGVLGVLEMVVPAFVFLGFAVGAAITGILVGIGAPSGGIGVVLTVFAIASLGGWFALRAAFARNHGRPKVWDRDINEN
jgi:membrane protein implicated in regulation of membrane protease activity